MATALNKLITRLPALAACQTQIEHAFQAMVTSYENQGKMLICGNGGSAADAEHWAGELLKGFCSKRPLTADQREGIAPTIADQLQQALPCIPLTSFPGLTTAFNNDVDPQLTFAQLTLAFGHPGDVLVGISTSGTSRNVLEALRVGKARGLVCIGLTGQSGGLMPEVCDITIQAPSDQTHLIQEYHLPIYHTLCLMLEQHFFPE
jgi:D-sedoheptulose 7-phosphate isomerase